LLVLLYPAADDASAIALGDDHDAGVQARTQGETKVEFPAPGGVARPRSAAKDAAQGHLEPYDFLEPQMDPD